MRPAISVLYQHIIVKIAEQLHSVPCHCAEAASNFTIHHYHVSVPTDATCAKANLPNWQMELFSDTPKVSLHPYHLYLT